MVYILSGPATSNLGTSRFYSIKRKAAIYTHLVGGDGGSSSAFVFLGHFAQRALKSTTRTAKQLDRSEAIMSDVENDVRAPDGVKVQANQLVLRTEQREEIEECLGMPFTSGLDGQHVEITQIP